MTIDQIQIAEEVWSLEDDEGLTMHHVADIDAPRGRTVMSVTAGILMRFADRVRERAEAPIRDERQNVIPFPRAA